MSCQTFDGFVAADIQRAEVVGLARTTEGARAGIVFESNYE